jgi:hypothetical protein
MQVNRAIIAIVACAGSARADDSLAVTKQPDGEVAPLDVRLTMSTFVYRQTGADAAPLVDSGAAVENASPVHRYFGDLRMELSDDGLVADARIRQTTSERYQSGADGGGEYEIRTLSYRLGGTDTWAVIGRQFVDAVGATKIDGVSVSRHITETWTATAFGGAFPDLGSRSVDTDYPVVVDLDGTTGPRLVPISGGAGAAYQTPDFHGDLGLATVYVAEDIPDATTDQKSRVFATSSGYWRAGSWLDIYHFALVDIAHGASVTNGSVGVDTHPSDALQLSASFHHVSTDLLQIAARSTLVDPDPSAIGIVQNDVALLRISQDVARASASLAMAERRFELSVSGGYHRRPSVSVELSDGTGDVVFPEQRSADATIALVDRKSIAGLRTSASASMTYPVGTSSPERARGTVVRVAASRFVGDARGEIEVDAMGERFHDANAGGGMCASSFDPLMCFGTSSTTAAQTGVLASWRIGRDWLLLGDTHLGYQAVSGATIAGPLVYPHVYSLTAFARIQWRYR